MLPLDQGRLITDIAPNRISQTAAPSQIQTRRTGLLLDRLEEFMLVDGAVQLPEYLLTLIISKFRRTVICDLLIFIVFVWWSR